MLGEEKSHRRKSLRLPDYDYSSGGDYFITIVTHKRITQILTHFFMKEFVLNLHKNIFVFARPDDFTGRSNPQSCHVKKSLFSAQICFLQSDGSLIIIGGEYLSLRSGTQ